LSSFIRVAGPNNSPGMYDVDLYMAYSSGSFGLLDPIDSLQHLYNNWLTGIFETNTTNKFNIRLSQNDSQIRFDLSDSNFNEGYIELFDSTGRKLYHERFNTKVISVNKSSFTNQVIPLYYRIGNGAIIFTQGKVSY
jgi:hypothetical protein